MQKIIFVVPYFGRFPKYFNAWLRTVEWNATIDFLLITDQKELGVIPSNVKIVNMSFDEMREYIQSKFAFEVCLPTPYKLCDFRPAFGYIFSEYLVGYDFWGHCDIDCLFGDLRKFLDKELECYDVIGSYGHLSLYKNSNEINFAYLKDGAAYSYKEVFGSKYNYAFDEVSGIKKILQKHNYNFKKDVENIADIVIAHRAFKVAHGYDNYKQQIFLWDKGKVYQCYLNNGDILYKEFSYLHFQKKNPTLKGELGEQFFILKDAIIPRRDKSDDIGMIKKYALCSNVLVLALERVVWFIKKGIKLIKEEKQQRAIYNYKRKF